ncbi:MAG TPA: response regulator [Stellaceae bacterium]|jgi:CheY-like chemotaxis protein|nr:response regulator [Stellaceae bacterium]
MTAAIDPAGNTTSRSILIVDDDEGFREALGAQLRLVGYGVRLAPDYRLALEILESDETVDLLLLDIVMPDRVNGLALGRMARLRRREIKIIYISGYDVTGLDREALGPIIRKPVNNDELLEEIRRLLAS